MAPDTPLPDRARIEALIPHAGAMCLLDRVEAWDGDSIVCRASSHRDPANPLREGDRLPVEAAIEYAAQAMAVHGGLTGGAQHPRRGYVAVLSDVHWHDAARLDDEPGELRVEARSLVAGDDGQRYAFRVTGDAGGARVTGEALVVLEHGEG